MISDEALLQRTIANNAAWCDAVCRAHGMAGSFLSDAWLNRGQTPRYYPNVITLSRSAGRLRVAELLDQTSGAAPSVKDSFGDLDLGDAGCELLFRAEWMVHAAAPNEPAGESPLTWGTITAEAELAAWEASWTDDAGAPRTFLPVLLREPAVTFWAGRSGDEVAAGGITFASHDVVSVSNTFFREGAALRGLVRAVAERGEGAPIVGYEHGEALRAAVAGGFRSLGPLAVWVRG